MSDFHPKRTFCLGLPMREIRNIVILTGSGISAGSGLSSFRTVSGVKHWDTGDGHLDHRVERLASPALDSYA
jgi:NAD-dependent SIR2 family protein deacetylase